MTSWGDEDQILERWEAGVAAGRGRVDAEDDAMEAMINLRGTADVRNEAAFVSTAAKRRRLDRLKKRRREELTNPFDFPQQIDEWSAPTEEEAVHHVMVDQLLQLASQRLSRRQYRAFEVLCRGQYTIGEAIDFLEDETELSRSAIRTHLLRATAKIRESWEDYRG